MQRKIYDYADGDEVNLFMVIKAADVRVAKNGNKYIAFTFSDPSGDITAKYWDAQPDEISRFQPGKVVLVTGKRDVYQGKPQIKLHHLRLTTANEPHDPAAFIPAAPCSQEQLEGEINQYVKAITNPTWQRIVEFMLRQFHDAFFTYPAAKTNHHAFLGGLAYHTVSILRLAEAVGEQYSDVRRDLLYAGAILHDLGKTVELTGPVATQYTVAGNLLGHIVLIDERIVETCAALGIDQYSEDALLLRHMVIAHHGLLEYGSPERPALLEAEILHHLDDLDATIQMVNGALSQTEQGQFSARIFGLDNRRFYRPQQDATPDDK